MRFAILLTLSIVSLGVDCAFDASDLDFDIEDDEKPSSPVFGSEKKENSLQDSMLKAMQKPAMREQIGQVIPILRAMSPQQRLTLAALVSAQITTPHKDEQSLNQVATMFSGPGQNTRNVTEQLLLPISMDIAKMFRSLAAESGRSWRSAMPPWNKEDVEPKSFPKFQKRLPFNITAKEYSTIKKVQMPPSVQNTVNRRNGLDEPVDSPDPSDCEYVTTDMCLEVSHYPEEQILNSIHKQMGGMGSFLSDFQDMKQDLQNEQRLQRRQDDINDLSLQEGYMCPSTVKYAKPKRARTTAGQWKYIVNTGDYTQTLRLESCINAGTPCSYLNDNFRSTCNQVYNYHRLMTWDEKRGLHMDVFKVPSCCSCHVEGYATIYPPQDYSYAENRREVLVTAQSSSGVKREIPRPGHGYGRPNTVSHFQNIQPHKPGKPSNPWLDQSIEDPSPNYKPIGHQQNQPSPQQPVHIQSHVHPQQAVHGQQSFRRPPPNFGNQPSQSHDVFINQQQPNAVFGNQPAPHQPSIFSNNQNLHLGPGNQPAPHQPVAFSNNQLPHFGPTTPTFEGPPKVHNNAKKPYQHVNVVTQAPFRETSDFYAHPPHSQQEFQKNKHTQLDLDGFASGAGLVDHLIPPGPPSSLDRERPRPAQDLRRRNTTANRISEAVTPTDQLPTSHRKRGNQRHEGTLTMPMEQMRPTRPLPRPSEPTRQSPQKTEDRNPSKHQDGNFGSKIRGKLPQYTGRPTVFVTPTTPLAEEPSFEAEPAVRVTPKAPNKKINYNYHPIIDFFARDLQSTKSQFNQPQIYAQRRHEINHEWTPMLP